MFVCVSSMCELCALVQQRAVPGIRRRRQAGHGVEESCVCRHTHTHNAVAAHMVHLLLVSRLCSKMINWNYIFGPFSTFFGPQNVKYHIFLFHQTNSTQGLNRDAH